MCGICGVAERADLELTADMLASISHRGPDSFDTVLADSSSFGGCRLTIVGQHTTPLPTADETTGTRILLNGEIYNYRGLSEELGCPANADDPEAALVARLLAKSGPQAIARLTGMFAFVVLRDGKLFMGRDRFGIKPLFYAKVGREVVFGSELKAVLRHPGVPTTLDTDALDETMVFGYITSPTRTPFAAVRQVPPGSVVVIGDGVETVYRYWAPSPALYADRDGPPDLDQAAGALLETLRASVGTMLRHDRHQKGFYLSGGVDSSLLATLAAEHQAEPVMTFTLADTDDAPDLLAARAVARAIVADHHEFRVGLADYLAELPVFVRHYENVIAGGVFDLHGGMAFQILSRHISEYVRVAFSGEGADELFGGYYWAYTHPLGFADRIRQRLDAVGRPMQTAAQVDTLFPQPEDADTYRRNLFDFLLGGGLANYHLWSVDRSCSAFGFEVRPAYLHDDIVDLALSLPIELKAMGTETKRVLKAAAVSVFRKLGIEESATRLKEGMPAAVRNVARELDAYVQALVPEAHVAKHPFARYVKTPLDAVMFDLFHFIFVANRGDLPSDFRLDEFYRGGEHARMYR